MKKTHQRGLVAAAAALMIGAMLSADVLAQRGGRGGGGRSAGHRSPSASAGGSRGPAMSRPTPNPSASRPSAASRPSGVSRPGGGAATTRPSAPASRPGTSASRPGASLQKPSLPGSGASSFQRPGGSTGNNLQRPGSSRPDATRPDLTRPGSDRPGSDRPTTNRPGTNRPGTNRPGAGTGLPGVDRPGTARPGSGLGSGERTRPGGGATSDQLNDFLGISAGAKPGVGNGRPGLDSGRPGLGDRDRAPIADRDRSPIGDRNIGSRDINIDELNVDRSINFSDNREAWIDNRHVTGDRVRANAGDRYWDAYRDGFYRHGVVGGYGYHVGWNQLDPFYGWRIPTYAAVGAFLGASFANRQPVYYAYGSGGNVYYENNVVYVNGQPSGTPQEYAQQALEYVEAAPPADQVQDEDWLPLGVFAMTREDVDDSQTMLELAVNKQGVLAGTYYNEATETSRPLKGTMDPESQRAVIGFADGNNEDVALETGIYNLTQEEAPGLLHHGTEESTSILLVRLAPPEESAGN